MKEKNNRLALIILTAVVSVFIITGITTTFAGNRALKEDLKVPYDYSVVNPYESVDWNRFKPYKANLHTHTNLSDGKMNGKDVIDKYYNEGYSILSITDHNMVTWPWSKFGKDPKKLNMLAVMGNEISNTNHLGSYFIDYNSKSSDEYRVLKEIGKKGGLAVLFHPGRYNRSLSWYEKLYKRFDHLVGFEAINMWNKYKYDEQTWDKILTRLMPGRPVWGFANDDMHNARQAGLDWNTFYLSELSEKALKKAMKNGHFYFSSKVVVNDPKGKPPVINRILYDEKKNTITIKAQNYDKIEWKSNEMIVHTGETLNCNNLKGIQGYVRAIVIGKGGKSYTQPFGMIKKE